MFKVVADQAANMKKAFENVVETTKPANLDSMAKFDQDLVELTEKLL